MKSQAGGVTIFTKFTSAKLGEGLKRWLIG